MVTPDEIQKYSKRMKEILGLTGSPIGVRLQKTPVPVPGAEPAKGHRYCQALMRARHGDHVIVDASTISCPAAARAFGFRPLPEPLKTGKSLMGFGITAEESVGRMMFERMPVLGMGAIAQLDVFPLDKAVDVPDIVVVEDEVEKLMWIILSYMHAKGGERVNASTAVLQATCVDSTVIPFIEQRLNFGLGCYGCRDATDIGHNETVVGFPVSFLPAIVEHLEHLNKKALPQSRGKHALAALKRQLSGMKEVVSCASL
ncbi:MAG: DUF169 domain-containing protein [Methanoregula sp.]|jgi:uncharacterized protein (DUF169 family)